MPAANRQRDPGQMRKALSQRFQVSYVGPDLRRRTVPNPFALLAFLRSEIPTEDISANPVMVHPHNSCRTVPERLPAAEIKELSALQPTKALIATAVEWAAIAVTIALCSYFWNPVLYVVAAMIIGARQHALGVLGHDASHYRYLRARWKNDLFGNLFAMWPTFASVEGFRKFHGTHHQYTNLSKDGNRQLWHTHNARGEFEPEWVFPKTRRGLVLMIVRRAAFLTGISWVIRGLLGGFFIAQPHWMNAARVAFYASIAAALTYFGAWFGFVWYWLVPFCTWQIAIQYIRLICEHSAVDAENEYGLTRTTLPTRLEAILVLPRNIGFHIEHHWYPSVPFYRLPQLHQLLMARKGFQAHAVVRRSVFTSLGDCIAGQGADE